MAWDRNRQFLEMGCQINNKQNVLNLVISRMKIKTPLKLFPPFRLENITEYHNIKG